jgi:hypothetical protein
MSNNLLQECVRIVRDLIGVQSKVQLNMEMLQLMFQYKVLIDEIYILFNDINVKI